MNKITTYKGHKWIHFKNGLTLSIYNGYGSYSENHFNLKVINKRIIRTNDCEIALTRNNKFVTKVYLISEDDVIGYVIKKELKEIIRKLRKLK